MWTFDPVLKETIWGGHRIASFKGDADVLSCAHPEYTTPTIGESWEIADMPGCQSVVASGIDKGKTLKQLLEEQGPAILGKRNYIKYGANFPLLIKFIDAAQDLSVQVHPDVDTARRLGYPNGKTEMWYIIDADKGSFLINGLNRAIDRDEYDLVVNSSELLNRLNYIDVHPGDAFFIPSGRIHALGAGTFVCEIQESSDVTFRLFDYHRKGPDGRERELHTQQAFEVISKEPSDGSKIQYTLGHNVPVTLVASPLFTTNLLHIDEQTMRDYSEWDTFVVLVATAGCAEISCQGRQISLSKGHSVLIPASANNIEITPQGDFTALEVYIK